MANVRGLLPPHIWQINFKFVHIYWKCNTLPPLQWCHDGREASQITSLTIVYSIVYTGTDQRKHQRSAFLAFERRIQRWPVNSPHKEPVTRKMISFDDVIMLIPPLYPQVVTMLCQFTFGLVAVIFCGQLGKFELDAVSLANSVSLLSNFVWLLVIKFLRVSNEINAIDC